MCKPTKNQFLNSSWDLGREIDPALAIVAAAVVALPNNFVFFCNGSVYCHYCSLFMSGCLEVQLLYRE